MRLLFTALFLIFQDEFFVHGDAISNSLRSRRATDPNKSSSKSDFSIKGERTRNLKGKNRELSETEFTSGLNEVNFVETSPSPSDQDEIVHLIIQWKKIVNETATEMPGDFTSQTVQEPISFSQLLKMKNERLHGEVSSLGVSSENDENDEQIQVTFNSQEFGFTAVSGPSQVFENYHLENNPAIERVEVDSKLEPLGFLESEPFDDFSTFQVENNENFSSRTLSSTYTDYTSYGLEMVQSTQIDHHPTNKMRICVVDTGYSLGHRDLPTSDNGVSGWNHETAYGDQKWDIDVHGHGTHVAGTIAAIRNNQWLHGVEDDPNRFYLSIGKGLSDSGWGSNSIIVEAVEACVINHGANVVNLSLGTNTYSRITEDFFAEMYDRGVLIVAAAGNSWNSNHQYPASYPSVMSVGAVDSNKNRAGFSTYNHQTEIVGPGVSIPSTYKDNRFTYMSGTSMASPHVAAVALKVWSWFPQCTNNQIRNVLLKTAEPRHNGQCNIYYGHGIVRAAEALQMLQTYGCEAGGIEGNEALSSYATGGCSQLSNIQTRSPTMSPTRSPTASPTDSPTSRPVVNPTDSPTASPTRSPTKSPTAYPTTSPTVRPTKAPTERPTPIPTGTPTSSPTLVPTPVPTGTPTSSPTLVPTPVPTSTPTSSPTLVPTPFPTSAPTSSGVFNPEDQYTYLGCFRDALHDRALPTRIPGQFHTAHDCNVACDVAGFKYSGRQYIGECWCGNSGYDKHGSSTECNDCDSVNVGGYLNCVHEKVTITPSPTSMPIPVPTGVPTTSRPVSASNDFGFFW